MRQTREKNVFVTYILTCTQIYSVHKRIYDLALAHMRIYPAIQVSSMDLKQCICIFVLGTDLYILSITLHFSHFLFHTKNPKQCYRISVDIHKHRLFLGVVQVDSFLRGFDSIRFQEKDKSKSQGKSLGDSPQEVFSRIYTDIRVHTSIQEYILCLSSICPYIIVYRSRSMYEYR